MARRSTAQRLIGLVATAGLLAGSACGSVTDDRIQARDQATKATCDQYQFCNLIGPGLTYDTYDTCATVWRSNWEQAWPTNLCQGRIDPPALNLCLNAISGTSCSSVLDFLATLGKCSKDNVCIGAADAAVF